MVVLESLKTVSDSEFELFRELILRHTGIFLKEHKRALLASRLTRRLAHLGLPSLHDYYSYLAEQDPTGEELRRMINCITTNKTSFFRENHHFEFLRDHLIPEARARAADGAPRRLRFWSAACSTGEEPYSIAITVLDALGAHSGWDLKILASDIDTEVLERAESGVYALEDLREIPENIRQRSFLRGTGEYAGLAQVRPELRRMVTFRRINFVEPAWPVETRFDGIFCRNVIIYFDRQTQRRILERLLAYLTPDGCLFVGHSENLYWMTDLVRPVRHTIYRLLEGKHL